MPDSLTTKMGYDLFEIISALQKSIRRGKEDDALYFGAEILDSGFSNVAWKRILVMSTEDIGLANPVAPVVINAYKQRFNELKDDGERRFRLPYIQAILYLVRSKKSRHTDWALNYWFDSHLGTSHDKPKPEQPSAIPTIKGYDSVMALSAFKDAISKGNEADAMFWGVELIESGYVEHAWRSMMSMVAGPFRYADPMAEDIITALRQQHLDLSKNFDKKKQYRLPYTQAILYLCHCNRWSNDVNETINGLYVTREKRSPFRPIPDYALDIHTRRGRMLGKTIDTFFTEGSIIENAVEIPNEAFYRAECRKRWNSKEWCAKADAEKARRDELRGTTKKNECNTPIQSSLFT